MSDGPHRSLKMSRGWKKIAERAGNEAYTLEEVRDALLATLERDWRAEVPDSLCRRIRDILGDDQGSLFGDQRARRLEALRGELEALGGETAGYVLGGILVDRAIEAAARGLCGGEALREAAGKALETRIARGARQVEEHYRRESPPRHAARAATLAADRVRRRIETGATESDIAGIVARLVGIDKSEKPRPARQTGLDDGVRL